MVPDGGIFFYSKYVYSAMADTEIDEKSLYSTVIGLKELTIETKRQNNVFNSRQYLFMSKMGTYESYKEIIIQAYP